MGSAIRNRLIQVAADRAATELGRQRLSRDGTARPVAITTAWLLRQGQGRQVLGKALRNLKMDLFKRRVLQTIAGAFPGNALLCRWKLRNTATCDLCSCPAETQAHIQCVCPALKGARIAAHHTLAGMIFNTIREAGGGWDVHRELTVAGLQGIPVVCTSRSRRRWLVCVVLDTAALGPAGGSGTAEGTEVTRMVAPLQSNGLLTAGALRGTTTTARDPAERQTARRWGFINIYIAIIVIMEIMCWKNNNVYNRFGMP